MRKNWIKKVCLCFAIFLMVLVVGVSDTWAISKTNMVPTEVTSFGTTTGDNYINVSVSGNDLVVKFHSEIAAYRYRLALSNGDGKVYLPIYDIVPVKDKTGNGFTATIENVNTLKAGVYYVSVTRARTAAQAEDRYDYGDGGNCFRNALIRVNSNKTVKVMKFNKVINHNNVYTKREAYNNPKDYTDKTLKDVSLVLYDENDKSRALTTSELKYIKEVATRITKGYSTSYDKAKAVYEYVATNTYYDVLSNETGVRYGTADNPYINIYNIENNGKTSTRCIGYAGMVMALLRSIDIPTRMVYGYHLSLPQENWVTSSLADQTVDKHYWNQFYDGNRWVTLDANMGTSNKWERKSSSSKGTWIGGNNGKKALNNYIYFDPSAEQLAVAHYMNGVYSVAMITKSNDVEKLYSFLNQKNSSGVTNAKNLGLKNSSYISKTRIYSWNMDKIYSNKMNGYVEKINISGTSKKDGGMVGKADLSELKKLRYYSSSYNKKLTALNLNNDSLLTSVYTSSSGLKELSATGCKSLKTLNATYNPLKSAKYTFRGSKTATISATTGGTFSISYSNYTHTLKAKTAGSNYYFLGWYDANGKKVSSDATYKTSTKSSFTLTAKFRKLYAPKNVKVTAYSTTAQKITWDKVSGATGYWVYKAESKNGKYLGTKIADGKATSVVKTGLKTGQTYYYYVIAYKSINGIKYPVKSVKSSIVSKKVVPIAPKVSLTAGRKSVTINFNKVSNVNGYEVYRAKSKTGKYIKLKTITKNGTDKVVVKNTGLTSNKKYYYKVRSYKLVNGVKVYSNYSTVKYTTTK